jgi:hypothetical protein
MLATHELGRPKGKTPVHSLSYEITFTGSVKLHR